MLKFKSILKMISFGIFMLVFMAHLSSADRQLPKRQLSVYWGQDSAGSLRLTLEKDISYYCDNYEYDIIPIAFLNVFFDSANKDNFPGINLANHCNTTFKGYPTLLNCTKIGHQIQTCQKSGKKILLSLGGAAGLYYFSSSSQAVQFANTIWSLFLGGYSDVRPFNDAVLDGVDLDIEGGTTTFYADFIKTIRSLMKTSEKTYFISGAPQCPYPDAIMGPGAKTQVLTSQVQEFDYLFVQFYNNYCSLDQTKYFNSSINSWLDLALQTKKKYGKGPLIFIGLPASPLVRGYQKPSVVQTAWNYVKNNASLGGFMLWDASFDMNNVISGQHYSAIIRSIMADTYKIKEDNDWFIYIYTYHSQEGYIRIKITPLTFGVIIFIFVAITTAFRLLRRRKTDKVRRNIKYVPLDL